MKTPRCPACRSRRASFTSLLAHIANTGHANCGCGGYPYRHRPGSPCCEQNRLAPLNDALRRGPLTAAQREDLLLECLLDKPGLPYRGACPF